MFEKYIELTKEFYKWRCSYDGLSPNDEPEINMVFYKEYCEESEKDFSQEFFDFVKEIEFQTYEENGDGNETYAIYFSPSFSKYFCIEGWYSSWGNSEYFGGTYEVTHERVTVNKFSTGEVTLYAE